MHFLREIWLRHVKYACGRLGIYFISHCDAGAIFHNFHKKIISHSASLNISLERRKILCYNEDKKDGSPMKKDKGNIFIEWNSYYYECYAFFKAEKLK